MRRVALFAAVAATAVTPGCRQTQEVPVIERDSAGVRIVENRQPRWTDATAWQVTLEPLLRLGSQDGPIDQQFTNVGEIHRLSDGRFVVAEPGQYRLVIHDSLGRRIGTIGRRGEGPGEFQPGISFSITPGDTIVVLSGHKRHRFDSKGHFIDQRIIDEPYPPGWQSRGAFADGSHLIGRLAYQPEDYERKQRGPFVAFLELALFDSLKKMTVLGRLIENKNDGHGPPIFRPEPASALTANEFCGGYGNRFEITCYRSSGISKIIRRPSANIPISDEFKARYRKAILGQELPKDRDPTEARAALAAAANQARFSETVPEYWRMIFDQLGHLWVREYSVPYFLWAFGEPSDVTRPMPNQVWQVFDPSGVWLGKVVLPPWIYPSEIGFDYIAGVDYSQGEAIEAWVLELDRRSAVKR